MHTYDLMVKHENAKSFYGKARVVVEGNKKTLYSYITKVAEVENGNARVFATHSATTLRHIKDFLLQEGFEAKSKAQIEKLYIK